MRRAIVALCVLSACSIRSATFTSGDGGDDAAGAIPGLVSISITPGDTTLPVGPTFPGVIAFVATGTFQDNHTEDISDRVDWSLDDTTLGTFTASELTVMARGARTRIHARAGSIEAQTALVTRFTATVVGQTVPPGAEAIFTGTPTTDAAVRIMYPNTGVLVPPNLRNLELHYTGIAGDGYTQLTFTNDVLDVTWYPRCEGVGSNGCANRVDAQIWQWLVATARGGDPITVRLRVAFSQTTVRESSNSITLSIAPDDVEGSLLYRSVDGGGTNTVVGGAVGDSPHEIVDSSLRSQLADACVGCHSVSPEGRRMAAAAVPAGGPGQNRLMAIMDIAQRTLVLGNDDAKRIGTSSWAPTGDRFVTSLGTSAPDLLVLNANNGSPRFTIPVGATTGQTAAYAEWSGDGTKIAYMKGAVSSGPMLSITAGSIYSVDVDMQGQTAGSPVAMAVATTGSNNFFAPAWAPDSKMLAFVQSICGGTTANCDSYTDPTASLYFVTGVGQAPTAFTAANAKGLADATSDLSTTHPAWNPKVYHLTTTGGRLAWLTFSSTRKYGLRSPTSSQIWMVAIDLDAPAGTDPSRAAFIVPQQTLTARSYFPRWSSVGTL